MDEIQRARWEKRRAIDLEESKSRREAITATKDNSKARKLKTKGPAKYSRSRGKVAPGRKLVVKLNPSKAMSKTSRVLHRLWKNRAKESAHIKEQIALGNNMEQYTFEFVRAQLDIIREIYDSPIDYLSWAATELEILREYLNSDS